MKRSKFSECIRTAVLSVLVFMGAGACLGAAAQNGHRVSGTVVSNGESVIGASVIVKGTSQGTVTNVDGFYTIQTKPDAVLVFSAIGYEPVEVAVAGRNTVDVTMEESSLLLDDAVVVG